jgi:hypothetical protein
MNGIMPPVRILERIALPAPFGVIFQDVATGAPIVDGLDVRLTLASRPALTLSLVSNRGSAWIAPNLPGRTQADLAAAADWSTLLRTYRIEVSDRLGRFLPLSLEAELPVRGLYDWPGWGALPQAPLAPLHDDDSPPNVSPKRIPLFSTPERNVAGPLADLRCQLIDAATGGPAAWALVTARYDGVTRGIGLADREGRATLLFPYPERPRPQLPTSPPAITDFRWSLEIAAYYDPPPGPPPEVPDLEAIMAQLAQPCDLLASTSSPPELLGSQLLSFGRPLVLRTGNTPDGPSSSLFLERP